MSTSPHAKVGDTVAGQFRLEVRLGSGGMGTVWRARDLLLHRSVAIKLLACAAEDELDAKERFAREAVLTGKLRSPHVVQVLAQGRTAGGCPYIVMELLRGEDLGSRIEREGKLPPRQVLAILRQIALALAQTHEQGLVHRDIKPGNVFLLREGPENAFVKLLDFGIAKDLSAPAGKLTRTGAFIGTVFYISPEQLSDARGVGPSADIWATAAMTYEMLTGVVPFGATSSLPEVLLKISRGDFSKPTSIDPRLPSAVDSVFERAFTLRLDARFPSIQAFHAAVSSALLGQMPDAAATRNMRVAPAIVSKLFEAAPAPHQIMQPRSLTLALAGLLACFASYWLCRSVVFDRLGVATVARSSKPTRAPVASQHTPPQLVVTAVREVKAESDELFDDPMATAIEETPVHAVTLTSGEPREPSSRVVPSPARAVVSPSASVAVHRHRAAARPSSTDARDSRAKPARRRLKNYGF